MFHFVKAYVTANSCILNILAGLGKGKLRELCNSPLYLEKPLTPPLCGMHISNGLFIQSTFKRVIFLC